MMCGAVQRYALRCGTGGAEAALVSGETEAVLVSDADWSVGGGWCDLVAPGRVWYGLVGSGGLPEEIPGEGVPEGGP